MVTESAFSDADDSLVSSTTSSSSSATHAAWPIPSLILVKDTTLGTEPSEAGSPLELDFDALLHLGGPSALSMNPLPKSVCSDSDYLKMRFERFALAASPATLIRARN